MKLKLIKREAAGKKGESNRLRREGKIPAIVYQRGSAGDNIAVESSEFNAILRQLQPGRLSTTIFTLEGSDGKSFRAILKDIQYNPVNYNVVHLDFEGLVDDVEININVPIEFVNAMDCVGMKLGGVPRQVIRHLKVRCLPKDIPQVFKLDIKELGLYDTRRLSHLDIPNTVKPLADLKEVVVTIAKR